MIGAASRPFVFARADWPESHAVQKPVTNDKGVEQHRRLSEQETLGTEDQDAQRPVDRDQSMIVSQRSHHGHPDNQHGQNHGRH